MKIKKRRYTPETIIAYNMTRDNRIIPYNKISMVRTALGISSIALGLGTALIPMTTMPLIALGCYLLGYDSKVLVPKVIYKLKLLGDWIYCNRTPKRLKNTIKCRVLGW